MKYRLLILAVGCLSVVACGGGDDNGNGQQPPSSNANLAALTLSNAPLAPAFSMGTLNYAATVTGGTTATALTPVTADSRARVTVDGSPVASGSASQPVTLTVGGQTAISTVVTAEDGSLRTYTVTVTRPFPGTNANLADLALSVGSLGEPFDPADINYSPSFGHLAASTRVLASPEDVLASLRLNGVPLPAGIASAYQELAVGVDAVNVSVIAEDATTTKTYFVQTTRAPLNTVINDTYLKASTAGPDRFGSALALAGDQLLVGAPREQSSATGTGGNDADNSLNAAGAAYLLERTPGPWAHSVYLKASNTDPDDRFGTSVALIEDRAVAGAPNEQSLSTGINGAQDDNAGSNVGAAYVFQPAVGGAWSQTAYLKASNAESGDDFARSLAADGRFILIGAPLENGNATGVNGNQADNSLADAGAAYLFEIDDLDRWSQAAYLKASNSDSEDEFGDAVAISGATILIGARLEDSDATGVDGDQNNTGHTESGAVYAFERIGNSWAGSAYLKASNTGTDDQFGTALSIDGDLLAIGAPGEDSASPGINGDQQDNSLTDAGAVYVFSRPGGGSWLQEAYIKPSNPGLSDFFGQSLALRGNLLVVGAPGERSNATGINQNQNDESRPDAGAVYVFERDALGTWRQIAYVKASNPDQNDNFGATVAFDGDTLISGAPTEQSGDSGINVNQNDDSLNDAGAVYVVR